MSFGPFYSYRRLGIANCPFPSAALWAWSILRLPAQAMPVYQAMLVHSTKWGFTAHRVEAAERTIGAVPDESLERNNIIREVALHDTRFSARNVSQSSTPNSQYSLQAYSASRYNKIFYVNNEPDSDWPASDIHAGSNSIDGYTGIDINSFWDPTYSSLTLTTPRKIKADALGLVFLRLKKDFGNSRGHIVLPPCPTSVLHGQLLNNNPNTPVPPNPFWEKFFDTIHPLPAGSPPFYVVTVGGQSEYQIAPASLTALHLHYYSPPRVSSVSNLYTNLPMETVAEGAYYLRKTVNWYRNRYVGVNQPLPMDVLLREFGFIWNFLAGDSPKHKWVVAGGWDNLKDGLSWWNSWLYWVTRKAPVEFNLVGSPNGNLSDTKAVYANIHEPQQMPYTTFLSNGGSPPAPAAPYWFTGTGIRNQLCFNCQTNAASVVLNTEFIVATYLAQSGRFLNNFSSFPATYWNDGYGRVGAPGNFNPETASIQNFRLAPFGACYKVWAEVGADLSTGDISTGWMALTNYGQYGTATLNLQAGYSTVYIPVIKSQIGTAYHPGTKFEVKWGSQEATFGYGEMAEFPDSKLVTTIYEAYTGGICPNNPLTDACYGPRSIAEQPQFVYSSMVFPIVCYSPDARTITIKVVRSNGPGTPPSTGPVFAIGRPVVIPRVCSWLSNQ